MDEKFYLTKLFFFFLNLAKTWFWHRKTYSGSGVFTCKAVDQISKLRDEESFFVEVVKERRKNKK